MLLNDEDDDGDDDNDDRIKVHSTPTLKSIRDDKILSLAAYKTYSNNMVRAFPFIIINNVIM